MRVPLSKPDIREEDIGEVVKALRSGRLSLGPYLRKFEEAVAQYTGAKAAAAVSSGTAGLHLSLLALGLKPGWHVITTSWSFVASANVILYAGAEPVFVDVEPATGNLDPQLVEEKIERDYTWGDEGFLVHRRTGARLWGVLLVHVFGHPARMEEFLELSKKYNLVLVEDACEALGSIYKGKHAGTFGAAGVFAFYPNKQITTGEGGVVVSESAELVELVRSLANQGRESMSSPWLQHVRLGYNYRMDEMSAALGYSQMRRVGEIRWLRREAFRLYNQLLAEVEEVETPVEKPYAEINPFVYVVRLRVEGRDELIAYLRNKGIETRPYFTPIHLQPFYRERFRVQLPITEDLGRRSLALPFFTQISEEQIRFVVESLKKWVVSHGKNKVRSKADAP